MASGAAQRLKEAVGPLLTASYEVRCSRALAPLAAAAASRVLWGLHRKQGGCRTVGRREDIDGKTGIGDIATNELTSAISALYPE